MLAIGKERGQTKNFGILHLERYAKILGLTPFLSPHQNSDVEMGATASFPSRRRGSNDKYNS
jgi:hypothetical protein